MRLGLQVSSFDWPGGTRKIAPRLAEIARAADEAGFASLWTMDHFFQIEYVGDVDEPMLEAYTTLGYLAAVTRRIHLGHAGHRCGLPPPRSPGEDGDDA